MSQKEEIETIKERNITVKLSDADVERLTGLAARYGLTVGELIAQFVGDLTDGTYSNGSDERMYAEQWANRCWFSYNNNLLAWLDSMDFLELYIDLFEDRDSSIDTINELEKIAEFRQLTESESEDYEEAKAIIEDCQNELSDILNQFLASHNVSNEIMQIYEKEVDEWNQERKKLET